jgi:hypothetical protein
VATPKANSAAPSADSPPPVSVSTPVKTESRDAQRAAEQIELSEHRTRRQRRARHEKRDNADRHIDREQPFPRAQRQYGGSDARAERRRRRDDQRVEPDAAAQQFRRIGEAQQGAVDAHDAAAAQALQDAAENEHGQAVRERAAERRGGEDNDAGQKDAAVADAFAERGERQKGNHDRQLEAVDDPDRLVGRRGKFARHRRQRHIGDGAVEHRHGQGDPDRQGRPQTLRMRQAVKLGHRSSDIATGEAKTRGRLWP